MPIQIQQHDSSFGRWQFATWQPSHLHDIVDRLWYFEGTVTTPRERIFPDGRIELIVHLGPVYRQVAGTRTEPYSTCCVSGLLVKAAVIEAPPGLCAVLGIRLHASGALAVLQRPLHELADITVDLTDLTGNATTELFERCVCAPHAEARLRAAALWISERVAVGISAHPALACTAQEIVRRAGAVSISELRERTGWSKTRFTTAFKEQIGVVPKVLARIVRFRAALERLHGEDAALVNIALDAGYYDQSHFNAEFRQLAGLSPGDFLSATRYPGSASVAETAS